MPLYCFMLLSPLSAVLVRLVTLYKLTREGNCKQALYINGCFILLTAIYYAYQLVNG